MSLSVNVSIEPPDEYHVQEITYDGQEKYIQPLSMSDNFTKQLQKIDFSKVNGNDAFECKTEQSVLEVKQEPTEDSKELATFQPSLWPWDSVRNKLKNAFTEVSVLLDVMNICKEKKYMILDPVSQEPNDAKAITALVYKKKALASVASIISSACERIRASQLEARNRTNDFHSELLNMRQNWRLRKKENAIHGDLSYRSAGSRFYHTGIFEVTKNEVPTNTAFTNQPRPVALKVTIPSELEGGSFFQVKTQKDSETFSSGELSLPLPTNQSTVTIDSSWQQKLETAQNVLFNKELFSQLAREAVQLQLPIPTTVIGNQIIASLFPGIQLSIGLCHTTTNKPKQTNLTNPPPKHENKPVLEHSLHQLLRELHYNTLHHPMPHPTTATLGISKKRYLAGPEAYDRYTIAESNKSETILEQIMAQTQHDLLRLRTMFMIDALACEIKDPLIVAHWLCLNNTTKSSVKINIISYGYETLCRTPLVIHIGTKSLKAICRDGRVLNMSYESQELRFLLLNQVSQHQIHAIQALAKPMGWRVLSLNSCVGVGPVEPGGTASSIVMASPNGDRIIAIKCGPQSGIRVSISLSPQELDFYPSTLVRDRKWQNLNGSFREVYWERIEGKNFINKMEYLMASLLTS